MQTTADDLVWGAQQSEAFDDIRNWLRRGRRPFFYLAGYAGSGKTTMAAAIPSRVSGSVVFAAFTGKAADVMRRAGCEGATTLDALLYRPQVAHSCAAKPPCNEPPCGKRCRHLRERFVGRVLNETSAVADAALVVVDEVSMVGRAMAEDLLSFDVPVLVLGDVAQLPPIGSAGYFTKGEPNYLLTDVHRQALGSPVIKLATRVRKGKPLRLGDYGDSAVVRSLNGTDDYLSHDQVICGTHRTRTRA